MSKEAFTKAMDQGSYLGSNYPGSTGTIAKVRYMACLAAAFCAPNEDEFEDDISSLLLGGSTDNEHFVRVGAAFAACADRTTGNMYASAMVNETLKFFSGKKVDEKFGELLGLLERFLIASGDAVVEKAEEGDT